MHMYEGFWVVQLAYLDVQTVEKEKCDVISMKWKERMAGKKAFSLFSIFFPVISGTNLYFSALKYKHAIH